MRIYMCYNGIVKREAKSKALLFFALDGSPSHTHAIGAGNARPFCVERTHMARDFAKEFYHSPEWQMARRAALMRDNYLCVMCGAPAEEVHHKKHLSPSNIGDTSITMSLDNLESLCKACHFAEHRGEHGNGRKKQDSLPEYPYQFDANGQLIQKKTE